MERDETGNLLRCRDWHGKLAFATLATTLRLPMGLTIGSSSDVSKLVNSRFQTRDCTVSCNLSAVKHGSCLGRPRVGRFSDPDTSQTISGHHAWFTSIDGITRSVSAPTWTNLLFASDSSMRDSIIEERDCPSAGSLETDASWCSTRYRSEQLCFKSQMHSDDHSAESIADSSDLEDGELCKKKPGFTAVFRWTRGTLSSRKPTASGKPEKSKLIQK